MQHVLVHIDCDLGPIGAWGYTDGDLTHFYPESLDPAISARARTAMAARGNDTPVDAWFHTLSRRTPYLDDYEVVEVSNVITLPAVVAEFRKVWKQPR